MRQHGENFHKRYRIQGRGSRTGNWRSTYLDKDHTVKSLVAMEVGILYPREGMIEVVLIDERGSRLQLFMPEHVASDLSWAISERVVFLQNEEDR